ncbi:hypothetical protein ACFLVN_02550 [Chloroflexota bacterium]
MTKTRKDFEPDMSPMEETLEQVKATLRKHFEVKDWQGVDIILATAVAHFIPGEMLWLRFIGPSRSGRTELLRAIAEDHDDCAEMEVLTPAAFRGGFKKGPKVLDRINGKLVITKDIASILTSRKDMRTEIFGVLRGIKDGKLTADFGSDQGYLLQEARFDWILAATYYIAPIISGKSIVWPKLINWIFWIFTIAGVSTCVLLLIGGVVGGGAFAAGVTGSQLMAIITPYLIPSGILCTISAIAGVIFVVQILVSLSRRS